MSGIPHVLISYVEWVLTAVDHKNENQNPTGDFPNSRAFRGADFKKFRKRNGMSNNKMLHEEMRLMKAAGVSNSRVKHRSDVLDSKLKYLE